MRIKVMSVMFLLICTIFLSDLANASTSMHVDPDRQDPWNNCTTCHGTDLLGGFTGVACIDCHNGFSSPDPPSPGHHQPGRDDPYNNCTLCHGENLMGGIGPSCFTCHGQLWNSNDTDQDGVPDSVDNCPHHFNPGQEDTYPWPSGNNCGDACECEGNFYTDGPTDDNVDGTDLAIFKADFGRNQYNEPCHAGDRCNGNFNCDDNVDGSDLAIFKADFGRNQYNNPCPSCSTNPWCEMYQ